MPPAPETLDPPEDTLPLQNCPHCGDVTVVSLSEPKSICDMCGATIVVAGT